MKPFLTLFIIVCLFFIVRPGIAQVTDTTSQPAIKKEQPKYHSPKKAAIMSALLPGLGQAYNKKYWKIPVIYAGFAGLVYALNYNQTKYIRYRDAYKYRIDNDPTTIDNYVGIYRDGDLFTLQKAYNRYRDLSVMGTTLLYLLNIIDASVDAHMFTFDVGDDLSFHIQPTLIKTANIDQYNTGISFNIKF